eukprot:TRINITY_DN92299_c1_g1_i1.p5 TRINITY_DN92299_c1_g1~~TRINITY_DN92299_c1_g1_i1.p5  ORF type:complete len:100 (-),score=3.64 TRINITY_DN92299_c1_g1_i1:11-310(-)
MGIPSLFKVEFEFLILRENYLSDKGYFFIKQSKFCGIKNGIEEWKLYWMGNRTGYIKVFNCSIEVYDNQLIVNIYRLHETMFGDCSQQKQKLIKKCKQA